MEAVAKLEESNRILTEALEGVINSALHPAIALRCMMVDLRPIRNALKRSKEVLEEVDATPK